MPKERSFNPAQQQRKADKQKEIAKNKKQLQNQRNEKLAHRNPERLQRQIDEFKESEQRGALRPKDQETLKQLERDLKGIRRAREALGDAAPKFPSHERKDGGGQKPNARQEQMQRRQNQHLGKRRRDEDDAQSSDTDAEVRDIPMPRDTPPPIPRQPGERQDKRAGHSLSVKSEVTAPAKTVYSAAPQIRDLKKEAVRFMPAAVAAQKKRAKGEGRLLEPEEIDRLEQSGYYAAQKATEEAGKETRLELESSAVRAEAMEGGDIDDEARRLEEEISYLYDEDAEKLPRGVHMEEVQDDGD